MGTFTSMKQPHNTLRIYQDIAAQLVQVTSGSPRALGGQNQVDVLQNRKRIVQIPERAPLHGELFVEFPVGIEHHRPFHLCRSHVVLRHRPTVKRHQDSFHLFCVKLTIQLSQLRHVCPARRSAKMTVKNHQQPMPGKGLEVVLDTIEIREFQGIQFAVEHERSFNRNGLSDLNGLTGFDLFDVGIHVVENLAWISFEDATDEQVRQIPRMFRVLFHETADAELFGVERSNQLPHPIDARIESWDPFGKLFLGQISFVQSIADALSSQNTTFECEKNASRIDGVDEACSITHKHPTISRFLVDRVREFFGNVESRNLIRVT